ncbi:hypothetical protein CSOJ01_07033 [Colletotrichum sojae]|uniref:Uncharacterized protein n=1 Tax=Colletotrichum sojae TaxID=2175907 RepID=A0A8H6JAZ1_9PEZI|nr:hypothetical protein CSOJ01_07033 [Colletotrichum sojae]
MRPRHGRHLAGHYSDFRLVTRCRASSRRNGSPFSENRDQPRNASAIAIAITRRRPVPVLCSPSAVVRLSSCSPAPLKIHQRKHNSTPYGY